MATGDTEKQVKKLTDDLPTLGTNMELFSLSIRSLYAEKAVSTSVEYGKEFITLRDETRDDAIAYLKGVMPLNETCILKLQEFFEYYECLEFEEWEDSVEDLLEEVGAYKESCDVLVKIHEKMMTTLKEREDKAEMLCKKFITLDEEYEKEVASLKSSADDKKGWAYALFLVPGVNVIATPLLLASANSDLADAVAKKGQQSIVYAASKAVSETLIPALQKFIDGLQIVAGFFNIMHQELKSFDKIGEKKKLHYKTLKKKANEVKSGCRCFHGILPAVRSNFGAIPMEGTNHNYVDRWLAEQKKVIEENCKTQTALKFLYKALMGGEASQQPAVAYDDVESISPPWENIHLKST